MTTPDRIKVPEAFWKAAEAMGIQRSAILREAKLPMGIMGNAARRTTSHLFAMWRTVEVLGGEDIGHDLMTTLRESTMPPSFLVAFHAKNLGQALQRVARFKALSAPTTVSSITTSSFHRSMEFPSKRGSNLQTPTS